MNKMINKKAKIYFVVLLSILFLVVILPLAFNISYKKETKFSKYIGESQMLLLNTYEKGESVLYYIDRSAELTIRGLIYKYAKNGGYDKTNEDNEECGNIDGYNLWNKGDDTCFPIKGKDNIITEFRKNLIEYFGSFKEKIPEIEYEITSDESKFIGKAKNSLRIDVGENDVFNFKADSPDFIYGRVQEVPSNEVPVPIAPPTTPPPTTPPVATGTCSALAEYAKRYIGCAYASYDLSGRLSPPERCDRLNIAGTTGATYTCAGLTNSIAYNVFRIDYRGDGRSKCDQRVVHKIPKDPNSLKPGDFFSSEVRCVETRDNKDWCIGGYTSAGHTGIYIGRGTVANNAYQRVTCYLTYNYDPNGEPVFIHSNGGGEHSAPGVCYATYNQLFFQNSYFVLRDFCRLNVCGP